MQHFLLITTSEGYVQGQQPTEGYFESKYTPIYFFNKDNLPVELCEFEKLRIKAAYVRPVTLPKDIEATPRKFGFVANPVFLGPSTTIMDYFARQDYNWTLEAVKVYPACLRFVKEQTDELAFEAVRRDGLALQYVTNKTPTICAAAARNNGEALKFVEDLTEEICAAALELDGNNIKYIPAHLKTEDICLSAVRRTPQSLKNILNPSNDVCIEAVKLDPFALEHVKEQTEEMAFAALYQEPRCIHLVNPKVYSPRIRNYINMTVPHYGRAYEAKFHQKEVAS